jgi:Flp pilus assembly pilin Flp
MSRLIKRILADEKGVTVVEFALLTPVLLMALMGMFDLAYNMYMSSMLDGSIQKAARDSTLENASENTTGVDAAVRAAVLSLAPRADVQPKRTSYLSYSAVGKPEPFEDKNGDGLCKGGELFDDVNENGTHDRDQGASGGGGARDVVVYEVKVTYERLFPVTGFLGMPSTFTMTSRMLLSNQPWDNLAKTPPKGICR